METAITSAAMPSLNDRALSAWDYPKTPRMLRGYRIFAPGFRLLPVAGLALAFAVVLCAGCSDQVDEDVSGQVSGEAADSESGRLDLDDLRNMAVVGNAGAQFALGMIYATGDGVPEDTAVALQWMEKAAEQGHRQAQYELGSYYTLDHLARDYAKAADWLRRSAEQGYAPAQTSLGILYAAGQGVQQDFAEAFAWLSLAEEFGPNELAAESKRKVLKYLTPEELTRGLDLTDAYRDRMEKLRRH